MARRITRETDIKKRMDSASRAGDDRTYRRLLIIRHLFVLNHSIRQSARKCTASPNTVQKWKKRYIQSGYGGLGDLPRSGRPPKGSGTSQGTY